MLTMENRDETLIFLLRHVDQNIGQNDHFDFAFSPFWYLFVQGGVQIAYG